MTHALGGMTKGGNIMSNNKKRNYNKMSTENVESLKDPVVNEAIDEKQDVSIETVEETVDQKQDLEQENETAKDVDTKSEKDPVKGIVANCEKLNVRAKPNKNAEVLTIIKKGDEVRVIDDSVEGWLNVSIDLGTEGFIGYCMKDYIEIE